MEDSTRRQLRELHDTISNALRICYRGVNIIDEDIWTNDQKREIGNSLKQAQEKLERVLDDNR
jgi:hypothetical protein